MSTIQHTVASILNIDYYFFLFCICLAPALVRWDVKNLFEENVQNEPVADIFYVLTFSEGGINAKVNCSLYDFSIWIYCTYSFYFYFFIFSKSLKMGWKWFSIRVFNLKKKIQVHCQLFSIEKIKEKLF